MINKLIRFGCPYHGMIRGGEIHLPNGEKKPSPQPAALISGAFSGNTYLQRMPWAPGGEDTPEDIAAGRTWTDYAILGGITQMLHGRPLNGWIYAAADGTPWWVDASNMTQSSVTGSFNRSITLRRFGRVGRSASSQGISLSLSDTGQSAPALTGATGVRLADITPDGRRAIFEVTLTTDVNPDPGLGRTYPIGYWLLEISGAPGPGLSATISVLRTRQQALGTMTDTGPIPDVPFGYSEYGTQETSSTDPVTGITTSTYIWASPAHKTHYKESGSRTIRVANRVIAMWFDAAGNPTPVNVTLSHQITLTAHYSNESTGGPKVRTRYPDGSVDWSGDDLVKKIEDLGSGTDSLTFTLENQGRSQSFNLTRTSTFNQTTTHITFGPNQTPPAGIIEIEERSSLSSPAGGADSESSSIITGAGSPMTAQQQAQLINGYTFMSIPGSGSHYLGILRHSNNLVRLAAVRRPPVGESSPRVWQLGPCLTPDGFVGGASTTDPEHAHGSWNPATGEVVSASSEQVCWT